jgi:hypothetical protein
MPETPFIHIRSAMFHILPGEEEEVVNDGTYGKAFAEYLRTKLTDRGYDIPFVCSEDWGWWVHVKGQPFTLGLCVYGFQMPDNSLDLCVQVSAKAEKRFSWTRFRFIDQAPRVNQLHNALKDIVEIDPAIRVLGYSETFPLCLD